MENKIAEEKKKNKQRKRQAEKQRKKKSNLVIGENMFHMHSNNVV